MATEKTTYIFNYIDKGKADQEATIKRFGKMEDAAEHFEGEYDQVSRKVDNNSKKMRSGVSALGSEFPILGRALDFVTSPIGAVTIGLTAAVGMLHKGAEAAKVFDNNFMEVKNLNLDKSRDQIQGLRNDVLDLSFDKGFDVNKTSRAFFDAQSVTGMYGDKIEELVGTVGVFSQVMKSDFNKTVEGSAKAMSVFGFGVEEMDNYLASWAKTVQYGVTTYDQLANVSSEYIGAAAAAGQTYDSANKVFAMFTKTSKNVDIAATMTKGAFEDLKKLEKVKIKVFDDKGNFRDIDKILMDVNKKFDSLNDKEISNLIEEVGGNEGLRGMLKNVQNAGDDILNTFEDFDNMDFDFDGALENAKGDLDTMSTIVDGKLSAAWVRLGDTIKPLLVELKSWMADTLDWIGEMTSNISTWRDYGNLGNESNRDNYIADMKVDTYVQGHMGGFENELNGLEGQDRLNAIDGIIADLTRKNTKHQSDLDLFNSDRAGYIMKMADEAQEYHDEFLNYDDTRNELVEYNPGKQDDDKRLNMQLAGNKRMLVEFEKLKMGIVPEINVEEEGDGDGNEGSGSPTLNGVTVAGEKVRNVTINIDNLVGELNINEGNAEDGANIGAEHIEEIFVRLVRDAEQTLSSE